MMAGTPLIERRGWLWNALGALKDPCFDRFEDTFAPGMVSLHDKGALS
jgi:hypothetical protein